MKMEDNEIIPVLCYLTVIMHRLMPWYVRPFAKNVLYVCETTASFAPPVIYDNVWTTNTFL